MKEYVAYKGNAFCIEWYYDVNGNSEALRFFNKLSCSQQRKILMLFKRMGDNGKIMDATKFRNEGDKIYAFKPRPHRFLAFFYSGQKIIVTNAFTKKTQKLPENEKMRALAYKADYEKRNEQGSYYEK